MNLAQLQERIEHRLHILREETERLEAARAALTTGDMPRPTPLGHQAAGKSPPRTRKRRTPPAQPSDATRSATAPPGDQLDSRVDNTRPQNGTATAQGAQPTAADRALAAIRGDLNAGLRNTRRPTPPR